MTQPTGGTGVVDRGRRGAQTITVAYRSERAYLKQLRILGAWWCLGSSALAPRLLLLYPPAPVEGVVRQRAGVDRRTRRRVRGDSGNIRSAGAVS